MLLLIGYTLTAQKAVDSLPQAMAQEPQPVGPQATEEERLRTPLSHEDHCAPPPGENENFIRNMTGGITLLL